jgi:predicted secreted protein
LDLGTPIPVDRATMPEPGKRGGRASNEPEMLRWLGALEPGTTYQMGGGDQDGAHTVNRITQLRKVATKAGEYTIETSPVESGKRYLVFVTAGKPGQNGPQ